MLGNLKPTIGVAKRMFRDQRARQARRLSRRRLQGLHEPPVEIGRHGVDLGIRELGRTGSRDDRTRTRRLLPRLRAIGRGSARRGRPRCRAWSSSRGRQRGCRCRTGRPCGAGPRSTVARRDPWCRRSTAPRPSRARPGPARPRRSVAGRKSRHRPAERPRAGAPPPHRRACARLIVTCSTVIFVVVTSFYRGVLQMPASRLGQITLRCASSPRRPHHPYPRGPCPAWCSRQASASPRAPAPGVSRRVVGFFHAHDLLPLRRACRRCCASERACRSAIWCSGFPLGQRTGAGFDPGDARREQKPPLPSPACGKRRGTAPASSVHALAARERRRSLQRWQVAQKNVERPPWTMRWITPEHLMLGHGSPGRS